MAAHDIPVSSSPSDDDLMDDPEIDELDSDIDQLEPDIELEPSEDEGPQGSSSKQAQRKKKRAPGVAPVPLEQIDAMLRVDGIADSMSKEASFLLSLATERFIKRLADASSRSATNERRPVVAYHDISSPTLQYQELMFLQDAIPTPIPLSEALRRRSSKNSELVQDPSLPPPSALPSFAYTSAVAAQAMSRNRSRASASTRVQNGGNSSTSRSRSTVDRDNAFNPGGSRSSRKPTPRASSSRKRSVSAVNGYEEEEEDHSASGRRSTQWPDQVTYTGTNGSRDDRYYGGTASTNGTFTAASASWSSQPVAPPTRPGEGYASAGGEGWVDENGRARSDPQPVFTPPPGSSFLDGQPSHGRTIYSSR